MTQTWGEARTRLEQLTDGLSAAIDALAARGVRFTQAYAHTVCCPARAALFTGRHPQRGGRTPEAAVIGEREELAERAQVDGHARSIWRQERPGIGHACPRPT